MVLPGVAWLFIDVKLEVLVVENEAPPLFVYGEVGLVFLCQQIDVISVGYLCLNFNHLPSWLVLSSYCVDVTVITCKAKVYVLMLVI